MAEDPSSDVTRMLREWSAGDASAADRLLPVVYAELRRLAAGYLKRERTGHTLQPTALVNEAWMRLAQHIAARRRRPLAVSLLLVCLGLVALAAPEASPESVSPTPDRNPGDAGALGATGAAPSGK